MQPVGAPPDPFLCLGHGSQSSWARWLVRVTAPLPCDLTACHKSAGAAGGGRARSLTRFEGEADAPPGEAVMPSNPSALGPSGADFCGCGSSGLPCAAPHPWTGRTSRRSVAVPLPSALVCGFLGAAVEPALSMVP